MFPFSVNKKVKLTDVSSKKRFYETSGYELVTFDKEQVNIFAAQVRCCEPHWHSASELIYILQGTFAITVNQKTHQLKQGGMIYINRDDIHSLDALEEGSKLLTIQFSSNLFNTINHELLINYHIENRSTYNDTDNQVKNCFIELVQHNLHHTSMTSFRKMSLIYQLLANLEDAGKTSPHDVQVAIRRKDEALIKQCIEYINEHYSEDLHLSQLAEQANISYHYFSKLFKKVSNYNFKEYLTFVRINKAKFLLTNSQIAITDISQNCGFSEHKHLIAAFKKYCSMTPTEFRKFYISGINPHNQYTISNFDCIELTNEVLENIINH